MPDAALIGDNVAETFDTDLTGVRLNGTFAICKPTVALNEALNKHFSRRRDIGAASGRWIRPFPQDHDPLVTREISQDLRRVETPASGEGRHGPRLIETGL